MNNKDDITIHPPPIKEKRDMPNERDDEMTVEQAVQYCTATNGLLYWLRKQNVPTSVIAVEVLVASAQHPPTPAVEDHANCHDIVCNASFKRPRGCELCSCNGREERMIQANTDTAKLWLAATILTAHFNSHSWKTNPSATNSPPPSRSETDPHGRSYESPVRGTHTLVSEFSKVAAKSAEPSGDGVKDENASCECGHNGRNCSAYRRLK